MFRGPLSAAFTPVGDGDKLDMWAFAGGDTGHMGRADVADPDDSKSNLVHIKPPDPML